MRRLVLLAAVPLLASACTDATEPAPGTETPGDGRPVAARLACTASVAEGIVSCEGGLPDAPAPSGARFDGRTVGGQGVYLRMTSTNAAYAGGVFSFDATVQNLSNLAMGTADGTTRDAGGVRVFFADGPSTTEGAGVVTVANATGTDLFLGSQQPYFQYGGVVGGVDAGELGGDGILSTAETSAAKQWRFDVPGGVTRFGFTVYVQAETPGGTLASVAPQVTDVPSGTLVPGATATLIGENFHPTPGSNVVRIGGALATVTGGSATQLTVTVPCVLSGTVPVEVAHTGMSGRPLPRPLQGNRHTLAVGETAVVTDAAGAACNELSAVGGTARYVVAVYNTSTAPTGNAPFVVSGDPSGVDAPQAAYTPTAHDDLMRPVEARSTTVRREATAEERHARLLEENRREYERLRTHFARDPRMRPSRAAAVSADPVEPPATRKIRVARIDGANFCRNFTEINAQRVYYSGKLAIYEDADNTPPALRAANNPKMQDYYDRIGDQFNADMEPVIRNHFGDPLRRDAVTDNNGVLVAVFTPVINQRSPGTAGFVVSCDQFPNDSLAATPTNASSNFGEYFYAYQPTDASGASGYATFTPDSWYWSIRATFIHETKHVASYAARVANGAPTYEAGWLEEGTARHAEELWARNAIYEVGWKANTGYGSAAAPGSIYCDYRREAAVAGGTECLATNPRRPSLNMYRHFQSLYNFMVNGRFYSAFGQSPDDGSNYYATSWSLARYAIDRYGTSDADFLTALTQSRTSGTTNLTDRAGVSLAQLMGEWSLALAIDDYPGMPVSPATPRFPTWNHRDIFTGMNADPLLGFPRQWPIRYTGEFTLGSVAPLNVPTLRGGGVAWFELSGNQTAPQLLHLWGGSVAAPTALASTIRVAIARVE